MKHRKRLCAVVWGAVFTVFTTRFMLVFAPVMLALGLFLVATPCLAQLDVTATSFQSSRVVDQLGWDELVVQLHSKGNKPQRGTITVKSPLRDGEHKLITQSEFAVAPGASTQIRLPTRQMSTYVESTLEIVDDNGKVLYSNKIVPVSGDTPLLVDLTEPPRLAAVLRDAAVNLRYSPWNPSGYPTSAVGLTTRNWGIDPVTGDALVPHRMIGYGDTTLVLLRSEQLARMQGPALRAIMQYVLAGGALAIVISRPEDLRNPTLLTLAGVELDAQGQGKITATAVPDCVIKAQSFATVPMSGSETDKLLGSFGRTHSRTAPKPVRLPPDIESTLQGFSGGNLHHTIFGASANYGLGEVHLLAFDPTQIPGVESPWVQGRMVDLVSHAWQRHGQSAISPSRWEGPGSLDGVINELDPNRGSAWSIVAAALLLIVYAAFAGPVNFIIASRKNKPLYALVVLPVLSAGAFIMLVIIGLTARGIGGQARHLTLIEAGAGMSQGIAAQYRGVFTTGADHVTMYGADPDSVIDTPIVPRTGKSHTLQVQRDGVKLVNVATTPREVLVVQEHRFMSLGHGLSVVKDATGDITVTNRIGKNLRGVIVVLPLNSSTGSSEVRYFSSLANGQSKKVSEGVLSTTLVGRNQLTDTSNIIDALQEEEKGKAQGLANSWRAVMQSLYIEVDWWPSDVPVVIAQMDGGEGRTKDSGLPITSDRLLLRVIGYGESR